MTTNKTLAQAAVKEGLQQSLLIADCILDVAALVNVSTASDEADASDGQEPDEAGFEDEGFEEGYDEEEYDEEGYDEEGYDEEEYDEEGYDEEGYDEEKDSEEGCYEEEEEYYEEGYYEEEEEYYEEGYYEEEDYEAALECPYETFCPKNWRSQ